MHTRNPYVRAIIHLLLILWVLYSVTPFVWAIIGSFQRTVDAVARQPRFLPDAVVENNVAIAIFLAVIILTGYLWSARTNDVPLNTRNNLIALLIAVVVAGGFLTITINASEQQIFPGRWTNYQDLWLGNNADDFGPVGTGLLLLIVGLIAAGIGATFVPRFKT